MNTFHMTRIVLLVMLGISLSSSSPLERLKRFLDDEADDGCIPGVWVCPGRKRNIKTLSEPQKTVPQPAKVASASAGSASANSYDDDQSEDNPDKCPLGNLSCRRKRMLKRMLKPARRVERSAKKCPPGIWVC